MWRIGLAAAVVALSGPAWGQAGLDPVLDRLAAQGYGGFEVEREGGTVKVEAVRDGIQRELVYDAGTGRLVEDSTRPTGRARSAEDRAAGRVADDQGGRIDRDDRTEAGDDRDARGASGDDGGGRGRGSDDDDDGDDHGGRGGDDSGRDDSGGDDHGGGRSGGDDSGRGDDGGGHGGRGGDD